VAFVACAVSAFGQGQVFYQTSFDTLAGWTVSPIHNGVAWAADDTPSIPGGSYHSPAASLNYNNGTNHESGPWVGLATSPPIDLSSATTPAWLSFWCNNKTTEGTCDVHEWARVAVPGFTSLCLCRTDCSGGGLVVCPPGWHEHLLPLGAWGMIQIQFEVRSDGLFDAAAGMFIDDLIVFAPPPVTTYCIGKTNSQGCTPTLTSIGIPRVGGTNPFDVAAEQVLNNKFGLYFYGLAGQASTPFQGGTLCVAPQLRRTNSKATGGNPPPNDCSGKLEYDFNHLIRSGIDPALVPGAQVDAQAWYRDPADPAGFGTGLSNGIEFVILP
jgi:hypothetical protein